MTNIIQDWKPVVIHNKKYKNKQITETHNIPKPKIDENDDPPKRQEYTHDMIVALKNARTAKGLSQADLAKQYSISSKIISDIENKKSGYNRKLYVSLMEKLGVDRKSLKDILI